MIRKLTLAAAFLAPVSVAAQELPTAPYLPLELATQAAQTALAACAADGYKISVAIVARDGATKVHLKADNSGPHTVGSAQGKAFTSASMGRDTAGLASFIGENPQHDGLRYMDSRIVIQGGGLPIKIGGALVGGIGVGGAPGGHLDEACARAGLDAIGAE
ncbi:GlcG/HbpS family heme-binding protein [Pseudophaeobacter flagellatus]|uniref:GlcG/HbpS family heme-binding protein n=1 Tax=Pseudophaeobacter flagellatus TaxID=2899119 RepID=UPI001E46994D|nr:heme-binding protein [Pseudophaeobacter flagellatus]MCD9147593.1 heme-binding protein [Pseudophaeobacter flagellatus]